MLHCVNFTQCVIFIHWLCPYGGGIGFSHYKNVVVVEVLSYNPELKVGDNILVFLKRSSGEDNYKDLPHNGLHLLFDRIGAKPLKEKLVFPYVQSENRPISVEFPKELALAFAKDCAKDKDAMNPFEEQIKTLARGNTAQKVTLSDALKRQMMTKSKDVIKQCLSTNYEKGGVK